MAHHNLRIWPPHFDNVLDEKRRFDIRKNDRRFAVGDIIEYAEFVPVELDGDNTYTGRRCFMRIRFVLNPDPSIDPDFGLVPGYVALGLDPITI